MPMPPRLTEVGAQERQDHYHLPAEAKCFFWGEYTPYEHTNGLKWDFSPTNQLMSNFKKKMERRGFADWQYKTQAIRQVANAYAGFWKWEQVQRQNVALIPIPPSKARHDPAYDPRVRETLNAIAEKVGIQLDIRDCLSFSGKYAASHESAARPTPEELKNELAFDNITGKPQQRPGGIFLFDDMLTTGAHYLAVTRLLAEYFPGVQIIGNFIARRVIPNPFDAFEEI